jgi:hypothetical protein
MQLLLPHTNYWIVFGDNAGPSLDLRWGVAGPPGGGVGYQTINAFTGNQGASWTLQGSFATQMQLTASVVPEPGSMLLGLIGAGGVWFARGRKIKNKKVSGTITADTVFDSRNRVQFAAQRKLSKPSSPHIHPDRE